MFHLDFQKLGGIEVLWECLCSDNVEVKTGACDIVAELCQNNPYCQRFLTEGRVISRLVQIIENDTTEKKLVTKALYAISGKLVTVLLFEQLNVYFYFL